MKQFILVAVTALSIALSGSGEANAREMQSESVAYIRDMSARILATSQLQSNARHGTIQEDLRCILREGVDFRSMSRTILAAAGRRASKAERAEFTELFAAYAINEALTKLSEFQVTGISIYKGRSYPNGDILVPTRIRRAAGKGIMLSFRVRQVQDRPRVVDLLVDGYSAIIHYQGVFQRRARGSMPLMLMILRNEVSDIPVCRKPQQTAAN